MQQQPQPYPRGAGYGPPQQQPPPRGPGAPNYGNPVAPQYMGQQVPPQPQMGYGMNPYPTGVPPQPMAPGMGTPQQQQYQQQHFQAPAQPTLPSPMLPFNLADFSSPLGSTLINNAASRIIQGQREFMSENADKFYKLPKYYFAVSNSYVIRKLMLILFPLMNKSWVRRKIDDSVQFDSNTIVAEGGYLPPRDDINAPDLYIPTMSFVTYVLMVGFMSGTSGTFTPDVMATTASLGLAILGLEVLLIKFGLYLVKAKSVPWLDLIAFRGYKFVGLNLVLVGSMIHRYLYWPLLVYCASMMGLFLMRTYRKLVLFRSDASVGVGSGSTEDQAKKNYFLLGIALLQYPIYWILAARV